MARIWHCAWQLMLVPGFACLPAAGAAGLETCSEGEPDSPGGACAVLAYDDSSLLQRHSTPPELGAHHALSSLKALDAGRTSADQVPADRSLDGPQAPIEKAAALQLEDVTAGHAATMTDAGRCDGVFAQYSDVNLQDNMTFEFKAADSAGMQCSEQGPFGPNKCCLAWGSDHTISGQVKLPQDLGAGATIYASVSGWFGWIPIQESLQCKVCGEDCRACPSISKLLPDLFPCQPVPMAPCPLKAGTYVKTTSIVLSTMMQMQLFAGLSATVKWRIESPVGSNVASVVASGHAYIKA